MIADLVLQLLKDVNIDKAAAIDNISGKSLKDGANILAKPISELCILSVEYSLFSNRLPDCQIKTTIQKRVLQHFLKIIAQFPYSL